ncbi:hypothetical protein [Alteriqipengyuania sp.]|uniref:hypothetical protein n=1 Tax=Alteriqipengyuania sp. TaxID=2800692 RepID=UPI003518758E
MRSLILTNIAVVGALAAAPALAQTAPGTTITFQRGEVVQATPEDAGPPTGDMPICKPKQEDNCINSWEANKTGNRPINYWPGRPASEIDEPLPLDDPNG